MYETKRRFISKYVTLQLQYTPQNVVSDFILLLVDNLFENVYMYCLRLVEGIAKDLWSKDRALSLVLMSHTDIYEIYF